MKARPDPEGFIRAEDVGDSDNLHCAWCGQLIREPVFVIAWCEDCMLYAQLAKSEGKDPISALRRRRRRIAEGN